MRQLLKKLVELLLKNSRLDAYLRRRYVPPQFVPPGHFHSPLPDLEEVRKQADVIWQETDACPGVDLNEAGQRDLLERLAEYYLDFTWPAQPAPEYRYHLVNGFFEQGDGVLLHGMLRHWQPRRVMEVGSGFSSALMLDVNERFLGGQMQFTFIEPYPERLQRLLRKEDHQRCRLLPVPVQQVPLTEFQTLTANDILFIDSSHVSKIGSDVNFLCFEVLPRLAPGVIIHVHDIFWPFEYPRAWVEEGRAWNEAYLLRAFLQDNTTYRILLFNDYIARRHTDWLREKMPLVLQNPGGSLWLRKEGLGEQ